MGTVLGDVRVMSRCDRMARTPILGIERVNYLALLALGTFYFLCAFLPIYFGAEHAKPSLMSCQATIN